MNSKTNDFPGGCALAVHSRTNQGLTRIMPLPAALTAVPEAPGVQVLRRGPSGTKGLMAARYSPNTLPRFPVDQC